MNSGQTDTCLMLTLAGVSSDTWSKDITSARKMLGRSEKSDIRFEHRSISRKHCKFWMEESFCYVADCDSTNGTYHNGQRLPPGQKQLIVKGDRILVGAFELFVSLQQQSNPTVNLTTESVLPVSFSDAASEIRYLASAIHERMTPSQRMSLPGLMTEVAYISNGELAGDCFECFEVNDRWVFALFDPTSQGTKAALTIMLLRSELNRWVELTDEPSTCLEWINHEITSLGVSELHICATLAMWSPETAMMVYSTAGQHPPILVRDGEWINSNDEAGGFPVGVEPGERYTEKLLQLHPRDRVFFFTDGVSQAVAGTKEPVNCRAQSIADRLLDRNNETLREQVQHAFAADRQYLHDDALLVGCEVCDLKPG